MIMFQGTYTFCNSSDNMLRVTQKGNGTYGIYVSTSNEEMSIAGYSDWFIEEACFDLPEVSPLASPTAPPPPPEPTPSASPAPCNIWSFKGIPTPDQTGERTDGMLACTANVLDIVQQDSEATLFEWRGTNVLTSSSNSSAILWSYGCNCAITSVCFPPPPSSSFFLPLHWPGPEG